MEIIIFVGIPASGKSTYFKKHYSETHVRINLDMLNSRTRELELVKTCIKTGTDLVIDNTNITKNHRKRYLDCINKSPYRKICIYFNKLPLWCIERNKQRDRNVPENAIYAMFNNLEKPSIEEGFDEIIVVDEQEYPKVACTLFKTINSDVMFNLFNRVGFIEEHLTEYENELHLTEPTQGLMFVRSIEEIDCSSLITLMNGHRIIV